LDQLAYLLKLSNDELPDVLVTSYAENEQSVPKDYASEVCAGFATLGVRGVSIIVSAPFLEFIVSRLGRPIMRFFSVNIGKLLTHIRSSHLATQGLEVLVNQATARRQSCSLPISLRRKLFYLPRLLPANPGLLSKDDGAGFVRCCYLLFSFWLYGDRF
jgi:hypothetical protein